MNIGTLTATLGVDVTGLLNAEKAMSRTAQKFRTFGYLASATITLPIVAAGKAAIKLASDYEYSIQKIVGLTGTAQEEATKWSDSILKMSKEVARGPKELADALYYISSSGIHGAEALDVLKMSAKAATAGMGTTQDMASVLTSALNAYRGTGLTAAYATDVLVAAVREGKAEASGFATSLGQLIPLASNLGVSFEQVAGGVAAVTLTGASAANAAVYMKGIFNTLITASSQGEEALKKMGSSYKQLREILANEGLIALMQKLRDLQVQYGDELLSDVVPNIRAMTFFMSFAGKNFQYNTELMKRVTESTGALGQAFAAVSDTIKVKYDRAIATAQTSLISLGKSIAEALLPLLETLIKKLTNLTEWFNNLTEKQKQHKLVLVGVIALLGPFSLAVSVAMYALEGLYVILSRAALMVKSLTMSTGGLIALGAGAVILGIVKAVSWFKDETEKATKAQSSFNSILVEVNGNIKKMKDLTQVDYSNMTAEALYDTWKKANAEVTKAKANIAAVYERTGLTAEDWQKGKAKAGGHNYMDYLTTQYNTAAAFIKIVTEVDLAMQNMANANKAAAESQKELNTTIVEGSVALNYHKLILDQYDAALKSLEDAKALQTPQFDETNFKKLFLFNDKGGGAEYALASLEAQYAKQQITDKEYLDNKFAIEIANTEAGTAARLLLETQYEKDLFAMRKEHVQQYLQVAQSAITTLSNWMETSKQRELSMAADNERERELIEEKYFRKQKAIAILSAIINTAVAVTEALPNVALAVATGILGGVQVGIISSQGMAEGGIVPLGYPNDTYPARLTSGERVIPPGKLDLATGGGTVEFIIKGDYLYGVLEKRGRKVNSYR